MVTTRVLLVFALLLLVASLSESKFERRRRGEDREKDKDRYRNRDDEEEDDEERDDEERDDEERDDEERGDEERGDEERDDEEERNKRYRNRGGRRGRYGHRRGSNRRSKPNKEGKDKKDKDKKNRWSKKDESDKSQKEKRDKKYSKSRLYRFAQVRLLRRLMDRDEIAKVITPDQGINVTVSFKLLYLTEVGLQLPCQLTLHRKMEYEDARLAWDPKKYSNITKITMSRDDVWIPDLVFTDVYGETIEPQYSVNAIISSKGTVKLIEPFDLKIASSTNTTANSVECSFGYQSWAMDASQVNLEKDENSDQVMMTNLKTNSDWTVTAAKNEILTTFNDGEAVQTGTIRIMLNGKRK